MGNGKKLCLFCSLMLILIVLSLLNAKAALSNSSNYKITALAVSSGGKNTSSANYKTDVATGTLSGASNSSSYEFFAGFWYTGINPPRIRNISISPNPAYTNSTLNCSATYNDTESDKGNASITWYNGSEQYSTTAILNVISGALVSNATPAGIQNKNEIWNCTINATDSQGMAGNPDSTTRTISNIAPSVPEIGGPDNASRTIGNSQTLRCGNSTDEDGDAINYVFYMDTNTPSTTMRQNSTATTYTFSTNDGWTYYWRCKAEDGNGGVSAFTTQRTFTENTQPTSANMVYPSGGSTTTNRTPQFNWTVSTDAEGDNIAYQINITCYPSCSTDNRLPNSSTNQNWTTLTPRLKNFWDDNYYYNWTVRPWDGYEFGAWNSIPYTLKLSSLVSLSMINSSVNFSVLGMGQTANTTTNDPVPLSIRNDGNSFISVNMSNETSLLWASQPNASEYFKYRIDNLTGEEDSFNWTQSTTAWTNVPTSNNTVINYLNYTDATDSAEIEILVTVPPQEPPGTKSSRVVFTGFYIREI